MPRNSFHLQATSQIQQKIQEEEARVLSEHSLHSYLDRAMAGFSGSPNNPWKPGNTSMQALTASYMGIAASSPDPQEVKLFLNKVRAQLQDHFHPLEKSSTLHDLNFSDPTAFLSDASPDADAWIESQIIELDAPLALNIWLEMHPHRQLPMEEKIIQRGLPLCLLALLESASDDFHARHIRVFEENFFQETPHAPPIKTFPKLPSSALDRDLLFLQQKSPRHFQSFVDSLVHPTSADHPLSIEPTTLEDLTLYALQYLCATYRYEDMNPIFALGFKFTQPYSTEPDSSFLDLWTRQCFVRSSTSTFNRLRSDPDLIADGWKKLVNQALQHSSLNFKDILDQTQHLPAMKTPMKTAFMSRVMALIQEASCHQYRIDHPQDPYSQTLKEWDLKIMEEQNHHACDWTRLQNLRNQRQKAMDTLSIPLIEPTLHQQKMILDSVLDLSSRDQDPDMQIIQKWFQLGFNTSYQTSLQAGEVIASFLASLESWTPQSAQTSFYFKKNHFFTQRFPAPQHESLSDSSLSWIQYLPSSDSIKNTHFNQNSIFGGQECASWFYLMGKTYWTLSQFSTLSCFTSDPQASLWLSQARQRLDEFHQTLISTPRHQTQQVLEPLLDSFKTGLIQDLLQLSLNAPSSTPSSRPSLRL